MKALRDPDRLLSEGLASIRGQFKVPAGFPPAVDKRVQSEGELAGSSFPQTRWAFSHQRELKSTVNIRRGAAPVSALPKKLRDDIDGVAFTTMEGEATTWGKSVEDLYTDGIVILHRGPGFDQRLFGECGGVGKRNCRFAISVTPGLPRGPAAFRRRARR